MRRPIFGLITCLCVAAPACASDSGRYFGLTPPSNPEPFAPPIAARTGMGRITNVAFSPGFGLAAFSTMDTLPGGKVAGVIHESRPRGGGWSVPVPATAIGVPAGEGAFSADGRWFWFSSDRAPGAVGRPRAFRSAVRHGSFGPAQYVPLVIPADAGVYYPRQLQNGDLLFTSRGPVGGDDLFIARARDAGFEAPEPLAGDFNSAKDDWDLIESPDGSIRIWASAREGTLGRTDLFYSQWNGTQWSAARHLARASSPALETAPALGPDGKALFFLRRVDGIDRLLWARLDSVLEEP